MSAFADFYQSCADRNFMPFDDPTPPGRYPVTTETIDARLGPVTVSGISVDDARHWANAGAPKHVGQFLECFCDAERCDSCGQYHFDYRLVTSQHGERFCEECA